MSNNYVIYHLHSDLSNGVTNIDSVTKFQEYINAAQECGMKAMAFSEHGSVFEWWHKKKAIEDAGMKYIHAVEAYLTETLDEKIRDNYHCVLIAKNYEGFKELNKLVSRSFNRKDNHFYYVPRISFQELFETSDNILFTTACIGGVLHKAEQTTKDKFLAFMSANKHRCFFEIGHHMDEKQVEYNRYLKRLSEEYGIPLIAGTDTHVLNEEHEKGRTILQISKNIRFEGEDKWDLKFHDYQTLVDSYKAQGSLSSEDYLCAIENTNRMADMVEPFTLDRNTKYPHIYDNPKETFRQKIMDAKDAHPYIKQRYSEEEINRVIEEEFNVYEKTQSIDFMLLQTYLREWETANGIQCGYGRGSVSGSMIAYILGITRMDSLKFNLNFFRFMNPSRVTNADIDTDYGGKDRDKVKAFLLKDHLGLEQIRSSEIITFNTIALKGAIRDVVRALYKNPDETGSPLYDGENTNYMQIANYICDNVESNEEKVRKEYPKVFSYVDIINGTIVSIGTHPSGCLVSDLDIEEMVGMCSISTSDYPVSMINMKELDDLMYVKLDILGLDNIGVINETCKILGIDRLDPDNVDLDDEAVWRSIRDDTTLIFQWESNSAQAYLKKFMSEKTIAKAKEVNKDFSYIKWLSFGNGLIRPGCASFRDDIANGNVNVTGFKELDDLMYVKLDILGLDNIGVINETCKILGIDRLDPDNVDLDDEAVWRSIRDDTTLIFQWESNSAQAYLKKFMSEKTITKAKEVNKDFSYIKWLSFGNGLIRPGCASFRDDIANGNVNITGFKELDETLAMTFGRITMQEDIMRFCKKFCGYSDAESDTVRRGIAKKKGTASFISEIHDRFLEYSNRVYGVPTEKLDEIFPPIKQGILDASDYAFSWNHSDAYSLVGYICGYLRYYHPIEFITAALNIFKDNADKTAAIVKYAKKAGIKITSPKFGYSKSDYFFVKEKNVIAKGLSSVKFMSESIANELFDLSQRNKYTYFIDLLNDINLYTTVNSRQIDILIKIDYFSDFGNQRELLRIYDIFEMFKKGTAKQIKKEVIANSPLDTIVKKYSSDKTKSGVESKSYTLLDIQTIMRESEQMIKDTHMPDLSDILKVKNFSDIMGYTGYVSGNEQDRRKLFIKEVYPLKRKKDGVQFGYSVVTQSIGSGVESRFTVFNKLYNDDPIKKDDIILCSSFEREGAYFKLTGYSHIYE